MRLSRSISGGIYRIVRSQECKKQENSAFRKEGQVQSQQEGTWRVQGAEDTCGWRSIIKQMEPVAVQVSGHLRVFLLTVP